MTGHFNLVTAIELEIKVDSQIYSQRTCAATFNSGAGQSSPQV